MLQIYDKLLELPLFLGIGAEDLSQIVGSTKFSFLKLKPNAVLLKENDKCTQLYFLMDGKLSVRSQADDHSYSIEEEIDAPAVIQPEHMFGLMQHHSKTYTAATDCNLLSIDKNEILRLSENYLIFRLNFFNMLSTQAQRHGRLPCSNSQGTSATSSSTSFARTAATKEAPRKSKSRCRSSQMKSTRADSTCR